MAVHIWSPSFLHVLSLFFALCNRFLYRIFVLCDRLSYIKRGQSGSYGPFELTDRVDCQTLPVIMTKKKERQQQHTSDAEMPLNGHSDNINYGAISSSRESSSPVTTPEIRKSPFRTLSHRPLQLVFLNYACLSFLSMADAVLLPLMYSTPLEYGGLGLTPFAIGTALGTFGIINAIFQAKFLGFMIRHFGARKLYRTAMLSPCVTFMIYPVMKYTTRKAGGIDGWVILCIVFHLATSAPIYMAFGNLLS